MYIFANFNLEENTEKLENLIKQFLNLCLSILVQIINDDIKLKI